MNQKVLAVLAITAIILGVLNLMLFLVPRFQLDTSSLQPDSTNDSQKIPLMVHNIVINNATENYPFKVTVSLPDEIPTLFDCFIQVKYLTEDNVWKTISRTVGIVNYEESVQLSLTLDVDFDAGDLIIVGGHIFELYWGGNIEVEAYGYSKP